MFHSRIFPLFISLLLLFPAMLSAQIMQKPAGMKMEPVKKQVFDTANFRVYYDYSGQKDPDNPRSKKKTIVLLQIGKRYNCMRDYYSIQGDSTIDASLKAGIPESKIFSLAFAAYGRSRYTGSLLYDRNGSTVMYRESLGGLIYSYQESTPEIDWQLTEGDSTIAGYNCKRATAHFRGRDYVAWYSPAIALPYGPYKFNGLPGLIFCIYDTQRHYVFSLAGLIKAQSDDLIYLKQEKCKEVSREDFLRIERNFYANPSAGYSASGKTFYDQDGKPIKLPSEPYNPIELK